MTNFSFINHPKYINISHLFCPSYLTYLSFRSMMWAHNIFFKLLRKNMGFNFSILVSSCFKLQFNLKGNTVPYKDNAWELSCCFELVYQWVWGDYPIEIQQQNLEQWNYKFSERTNPDNASTSRGYERNTRIRQA
jgi:hypothetical protein